MPGKPAAPENLYLSAKEAAAELGVSLATLYAYVSRDMIRSEPVPDSRAKRYRAEDVRELKARRLAQSAPPPQTGDARGLMNFGGQPVLESAITLIADGRLYYRGVDATVLARNSTLEQVAALLWGCTDVQPFSQGAVPVMTPLLQRVKEEVAHLSPVTRCLSLLPIAAMDDPSVYNHTERGLAATGARLMRFVASVIANAEPSARPIHEVMAKALTMGDKRAADFIRAALALCADHELNASAFTARCVAGTGATLYASVQAGICAAEGPRHGGFTSRVESFLTDMAHRQDLDDAVLARLRNGDPVPGFGHPLYPDGDPRGQALMSMMRQSFSDDPAFQRSQRIMDVMEEAAGVKPSIDFAIGALSNTLRMLPGAGLAIFVMGRTAGWVGHAIEQHRSGQMIRPRARYTGDVPR
ncbi:MAG: citrate synthase family protein [Parvibaculum sp.]